MHKILQKLNINNNSKVIELLVTFPTNYLYMKSLTILFMLKLNIKF